MIPKIIHYCWFGGKEIPDKEKKCIESWKKYCPDYEIKEWNESNYDINKNLYIRQAYEKEKWAFVTDYVRLDVIYQYGGIYFDTDVEIVRNLDDLLYNKAFVGMENVTGKEYSIATGLGFGAGKGNLIIKDWRDEYKNLSFIQEDGTVDLLTTPARTSEYMRKRGFRQENAIQTIDGMVIYPTEYFSPKQYDRKKICVTENTYSIHHYAESWKNDEERQREEEWLKLVQKYGNKCAEIISAIKTKNKEGGVSMVIKSIIKRVFDHGKLL